MHGDTGSSRAVGLEVVSVGMGSGRRRGGGRGCRVWCGSRCSRGGVFFFLFRSPFFVFFSVCLVWGGFRGVWVCGGGQCLPLSVRFVFLGLGGCLRVENQPLGVVFGVGLVLFWGLWWRFGCLGGLVRGVRGCFSGFFRVVRGVFGVGRGSGCLGMWGRAMFALVSALCTLVQVSVFRG